jgi:anaerobic selenocysteine-containing dehydrogenase
VYADEMVTNPVNPRALTPRARLGEPADGLVHAEFPLMGMIGRSSVVHFAGVTHWTPTGKQLDGVRLIQLHPSVAAEAGIAEGDDIVVESPRGRVGGTALLWEEMRPDTVFVPNGFGFAQGVGPDTGAPLYDAPANTLPDDRYFDNLSGQQAYKCFACRVMRA